jgi:predicted DCC family thiol-disulfide oxidoreductase YuxK
MARLGRWNPLVCGGWAAPAPVVLAAKLVALAWLLSGEAGLWLALAGIVAAALLRWRLGPPPAGFRPYLIWGNVLLQAAVLAFGGPPLLPYACAMLAATPLAARWPREMTVIYDGDCGICNASRRLWSRLDFERAFTWLPFQSGAGARWNIPVEALRQRAHFIADGSITSGYRAVKRIVLYNPVTHFLALALIAAPPNDWALYRQIMVVALLLPFAPPLEPVGVAVYNWVARNRACALVEQPSASARRGGPSR